MRMDGGYIRCMTSNILHPWRPVSLRFISIHDKRQVEGRRSQGFSILTLFAFPEMPCNCLKSAHFFTRPCFGLLLLENMYLYKNLAHQVCISERNICGQPLRKPNCAMNSWCRIVFLLYHCKCWDKWRDFEIRCMDLIPWVSGTGGRGLVRDILTGHTL